MRFRFFFAVLFLMPVLAELYPAPPSFETPPRFRFPVLILPSRYGNSDVHAPLNFKKGKINELPENT